MAAILEQGRAVGRGRAGFARAEGRPTTSGMGELLELMGESCFLAGVVVV